MTSGNHSPHLKDHIVPSYLTAPEKQNWLQSQEKIKESGRGEVASVQVAMSPTPNRTPFLTANRNLVSSTLIRFNSAKRVFYFVVIVYRQPSGFKASSILLIKSFNWDVSGSSYHSKKKSYSPSFCPCLLIIL